MIAKYMGKDVNKMTKKELIKALAHMAQLYERSLNQRSKDLV